jgi:hypothetical protein
MPSAGEAAKTFTGSEGSLPATRPTPYQQSGMDSDTPSDPERGQSTDPVRVGPDLVAAVVAGDQSALA